MHQNSLEAHATERDTGRLGKRAKAIMWKFESWARIAKQTGGHGFGARGVSDRQVMEALHFSDMNSVRPRITELIKSGQLEECGSVIDPSTGKRVRLVRLRHGQQRLF